MNELPQVSVVINNYNYERYLAKAIDSALAQTYANCEVVVVDDGSTDRSRAIIESYGERVRPLLKLNGGQASAFNVGITAAAGEYTLLLDADDELLPHAVETALRLMDPSVVRLSFGLMKVDERGEPLGLFYQIAPKSFIGSFRDAIIEEQFLEATPTSGNFFRSKELKQCLPFPEGKFRISADIYLWFANAKHGDLQRVPEVLGLYRLHGANHYASSGEQPAMSQKQLLAKAQGVLNICELAADFSVNLAKPERELFMGFFFKMDCILTISDARLRAVADPRLYDFSVKQMLHLASKALVRRGGWRELPGRCYRFILILVNELLPHKISALVYFVLSRFFPSRF
jgi:glycosyltransferase involved in cell wall biosynthesis